MVSSRWATAAAGLGGSLLVSAAAWLYLDTFLLFLAVPFVPLLLGRRGEAGRPPERGCPECGFRTREPSFNHCPRDGTPLEER